MKTDSLIAVVSNSCDVLTNNCIKFLSVLSQNLGISYGEINVYLFIIWLPAMLLYFTSAVFICVHTKNIKVIKVIKRISYVILIINFIILVSIISIFFTYVMLCAKSENMVLG